MDHYNAVADGLDDFLVRHDQSLSKLIMDDKDIALERDPEAMSRPLDKFYAHEALHTTYLIEQLFGREIATHPFVLQNDDLSKKAYLINMLLGELYQAIGRKEVPS